MNLQDLTKKYGNLFLYKRKDLRSQFYLFFIIIFTTCCFSHDINSIFLHCNFLAFLAPISFHINVDPICNKNSWKKIWLLVSYKISYENIFFSSFKHFYVEHILFDDFLVLTL